MPDVVTRLRHPLIVGLAIWLIVAGLRLNAGWGFVVDARMSDPDAIMRLLQVRDWRNGQGWYDLAQYHIGLPGEVVQMHWSRVGDLLPAALIAALTPLVGPLRAEHWALIATPLILLLPVTVLMVAIGRRLGGRVADLPVAIGLLTGVGVLTLFAPGNIDHHSLQLIAVLLLVWACSGPRSATMGAVAGLAVALAMTIGIETAPHVVAILGAVALGWVIDPRAQRRFTGALGCTLMAAALAALVVFMPRPWPLQCDAWTLPVFWATLGVGLIVWLASRMIRAGTPIRLSALAIATVALAAAVGAAFPACRVHPAGGDPLLWRYWMDLVTENASVATMIVQQGAAPALVYLASAPVVVLAALLLTRREPRWLPLIAATAAALALTLVHVRGQAILGALTLTLAAALIGRAQALPTRALRLGSWLVLPIWFVIAGVLLQRSAADSVNRQAACAGPATLAALNALPPSTLLMPLIAEPPILAATRHRSVAATYHRNVAGNRAMLIAVTAAPDQARALVRATGARYLLHCPGFDTAGVIARENPASLAQALTADREPVWLQLIERLPGDVRLYQVR